MGNRVMTFTNQETLRYNIISDYTIEMTAAELTDELGWSQKQNFISLSGTCL